jgi:hypothetical protein
MKLLAPLLMLGCALAMPAAAQRRAPAREALEGLKSPREIERQVVPAMAGAQYLGFEFDDRAQVYTLKFLRDGRVIWVDVDGKTAAVIGRTGR